MFSRDQLSADDLSSQLRKPVMFLGNPFMDPILRDDRRLPQARRRLGLLPGSRRPELEQNLVLLLGVVEQLPAPLLSSGELQLELALVSSLSDAALSELITPIGWNLQTADNGQITLLCRNAHRVQIHRGGFGAVLHSSDLLLCMAGTAAEQAVGLARPVLQLVGRGPQFTAGFAEAQRRLLGPTVFCVDGEVGAPATLERTAALALELLERSHLDQQLQRRCHDEARNRLGKANGGNRMAASISQLLQPCE